MVGTFLEPSCGRSNAPIHNIPYSVAQPLERGSKNYYSIIQGVEGRILGELFDGLVRLSQGIHRIFVPFAEEKILPTPQKHAII